LTAFLTVFEWGILDGVFDGDFSEGLFSYFYFMKRWLIGVGAIVVAGVIYILIPRKLSVSVVGLRTMSAVSRCFSDTGKWAGWWPQNAGYTYHISRLAYSNAQMTISRGGDELLTGNLRVAPLNGDSVLIDWEGSMPGWRAGAARKAVDTVLRSLKSYVEDPKRLYGVKFYPAMSNDSTLVVIIFTSGAYPGMDVVYGKVDSLRQYIASQGARELNPPMLNVTRLNDSMFRTTVGISVNRILPAKGTIVPKRFVPWKMLEGEVHGGIFTVERAFRQMQLFKGDYNLQIMAIPYQSMVTDRRAEPDTAKWVTIVCAPIS